MRKIVVEPFFGVVTVGRVRFEGMVRIVLDIGWFKGKSGGVIGKLDEGDLMAVKSTLIQVQRQNLFDRLVKIDLPIPHQLCEDCAGKGFCDGSDFKYTIAVIDVDERIIASLNSNISLRIALNNAKGELRIIREVMGVLKNDLSLRRINQARKLRYWQTPQVSWAELCTASPQEHDQANSSEMA